MPLRPCVRLALLLTLALAGCAVPARPHLAPSAPALFAVVSWNMGNGRGDLSRLLDDLEAGALSGTPSARYIVLLQEAGGTGQNDVRAFAAARPLAVFFTPVRRRGDRTIGNAIISTVPLTGARAIALPQERQPRSAAAATVDIAGERLFVVSTHLENRLGWARGLFGDGARGRQAETLLEHLPPDAPGILGGDMNTMFGPVEPAWRAFRARFPDTPPGAQATFRQRLALDHLFFDLPEGWTASTRVSDDEYGSDHHPVVASIRRE